MAEFCSCGSIVIGGHCTNKNCTLKNTAKLAASKTASQAKSSPAKKEAKSSRTRRASKCITYNLYEIKDEIKEEENVL